MTRETKGRILFRIIFLSFPQSNQIISNILFRRVRGLIRFLSILFGCVTTWLVQSNDRSLALTVIRSVPQFCNISLMTPVWAPPSSSVRWSHCSVQWYQTGKCNILITSSIVRTLLPFFDIQSSLSLSLSLSLKLFKFCRQNYLPSYFISTLKLEKFSKFVNTEIRRGRIKFLI